MLQMHLAGYELCTDLLSNTYLERFDNHMTEDNKAFAIAK